MAKVNSLLNWQYKAGVSMSNGAIRMYRNDKIGAQCELNTKRRKNGNWGIGKFSYFLDGDKREFKTEQELLEAYYGKK